MTKTNFDRIMYLIKYHASEKQIDKIKSFFASKAAVDHIVNIQSKIGVK